MAKHVLYGGSTAEIWRNCPGWASLIKKVPRKPVGAAAHAGTAQHTVMERLLKNPELDPKKFEGVSIITEGGDVELHSGHIAAIEIAIEEWEKLLEWYETDDIGHDEGEVQVFSERFFGGGDGAHDQGGTVDGLIVRPPRASFVDFKFGQWMVEAEGWQNFWYMICARREMPSLFRGVEEWESVIIQPAYDPAVARVVIPTSVLDRMEEEARAAITASKAPNPHYVEGEWCTWCNAKLACPAKTQRLGSLTMPNHVLDLAEVEKLLLKLREWRKWEEEAEARLLHELEHGKQLVHFKLVAKRAVRKWINEADTIRALMKRGVQQQDYMKIELRSPAQMEEEGFLSKAEVKELAEPVSSGHTIAPMSDKRPAVMPIEALKKAVQR